MADHPQAVGYGHGKIFITTLNQLDVLSLFPFPLFTPLYIFLIYNMFLNKALHVFYENTKIGFGQVLTKVEDVVVSS
jgi:hypothetical protein